MLAAPSAAGAGRGPLFSRRLMAHWLLDVARRMLHEVGWMTRLILGVALVVVGTTGCDPEAPGAAGTITLDADVDATVYQALALRTFAGPYDPSQPIPSTADREDEAVAAITFPHRYQVGGGIGSSNVGDWQLVAWLSHRTLVDLNAATGPDAGDPRCSLAYRVGGCTGMGGYCGVTAGVDCVLVPSPVPSR